MTQIQLHHGDCLDVMRSIPDGSVDAVITDPPYGIKTKSDGNGKLDPWADLCNAAYWYAEWIGECRRVLRPSGCLWSCLNWRSMVTFQRASAFLGWPIESLLVWDKKVVLPGMRGLRPTYEMLALWRMPEFSVANRSIRDIVSIPAVGTNSRLHSAQKPVELIEFLLKDAAGLRPANTVLDPFMGSGTTGVACVRTGRDFIGIEMSDKYFNIASKRIADEQAKTALIAS